MWLPLDTSSTSVEHMHSSSCCAHTYPLNVSPEAAWITIVSSWLTVCWLSGVTFPLLSTVNITPLVVFFAMLGWFRLIPTLLTFPLCAIPRQSLPGTRSSALPFPTAPIEPALQATCQAGG